MAEDFHNLEEPFVKRNNVDILRDLCFREGLPHAGTKPTLVERIMEAVRAKQTEAVADALGAVGDPSGGSDAGEDVEASGDVPDAAIEVLGGRGAADFIHVPCPARSHGWSTLAEFGWGVRRAIRRVSPRSHPCQPDGDQRQIAERFGQDRYVPFRSTSWVWDHIHLRYSDEGRQWWCNHCAWDLPTGCPRTIWGSRSLPVGKLPTWKAI